MEANGVRLQIRQFMDDNFALGEQLATLGDDDSFMETGVIDSTGVLELVAFLEDTYGFRIADEEMIQENLDSIANICGFVQTKSGG